MTDSNTNNSNNTTSTTAQQSILPVGIQCIKTTLPHDLLTQIQQHHTIRHKAVHYGNRFVEEDNRYGLQAPSNLPYYLQSLITYYVNLNNNDNTNSDSDVRIDDNAQHKQHQSTQLNRVTLSTLQPGQPIKPTLEQDTYTNDPLILSVIGSHVVVELSPNDVPTDKHSTIHIILHDGDTLIINNPIRTTYKWCITGKTRDRINNINVKRKECIFIELRNVLPIEQQPIPQLKQSESDDKLVALSISSNDSLNAKLESKHVHTVYDSIASHFSSTRHTPWPKIDKFVRDIPHNSLVADIGCGNGKYMGLNKNIHIVGCDMSEPLIDICIKRGYNSIVGDAVHIPLLSNHFDVVLNIAVLHHISTVERRIQIIHELLRICKVKGHILISAWALEQDKTSRRIFPQQDVYVPWNIPKEHYIHTDEFNDLPDKLKPKSFIANNNQELIIIHRYCHVYCEGELEQLCNSIDQCNIIQSWYDRGNWCILVQKIQ